MNPKTVIKGKIHYVGVNDRNKHLFEGMWPLPYGVSYNSYLIDDETVALIDTVDICYFEVYLRKIKSIIGERPIQYLIINHMEPDHSGSIRLIKQHYPDIKELSKFFIVLAMAAIGLNTNIVKLIKTGGQPIIMGACCWLGITAVTLALQYMLHLI